MTKGTPLAERVSFRDSDHSYFLDGKRIPSVTTILGNLAKPALIPWAAKIGGEAVRQRILELGVNGHLDGYGFQALADELFDIARTAHNKKKSNAADKGNVVHDAIQKYHDSFYDAEPPNEEEQPAARKAWDSFIAWWSEAGLKCIDTERKIVAADGSYAGRLDMLCEDEAGGLFICDIKTSNGVYVEHVLQNAAYAQAISDELEREIAGTKVIWLPGWAEHATAIERDGEEWQLDYEMFAAVVKVHGYRRGMNKWLTDVKVKSGTIPF